MAEVIRLENITKTYNIGNNKVYALRSLNLKVNQGDLLAITGSSGSGKSTLMNIIGCLDIPTRGKYTLYGSRVLGLSDRKLSDIRRSMVGFIFQGFNLIPTLTAYENVELPLLYSGEKRTERRERVTEALEVVGLKNRMSHKPSQLSGGQQQRVSIGRALMNAPAVMLADEPTGNLDSQNGQDILSLLKQSNKKYGQTLIIVTHDENIALQADRIIGIADGKIVRNERVRG